jgi:DNA-binding NtrC family response regulator
LVDLFQEILESDGYKVCAFIDPIQAFTTLEKKIQEYGLILSDYRMPNLNGYELCKKLTQINLKLQVILMSAYDRIKYATSKYTLIKKPILTAQLLQIVRDSFEVKLFIIVYDNQLILLSKLYISTNNRFIMV